MFDLTFTSLVLVDTDVPLALTGIGAHVLLALIDTEALDTRAHVPLALDD